MVTEEEERLSKALEKFKEEFMLNPDSKWHLLISDAEISQVGLMDPKAGSYEKDKPCIHVTIREQPLHLLLPTYSYGLRVFSEVKASTKSLPS